MSEEQTENEVAAVEYVLPHTVELIEPIQVTPTITRTELVFKNRLTAKMVGAWNIDTRNLSWAHYFPVISAMTGEPSSVVEKLGPADLDQCAAVVAYFFMRGR